MNRLSKEKQNQLILVAVAMLVVVCAIGFGLIRPQYDSLARIGASRQAAEKKLQQIQNTITNASLIETKMAETSNALNQAEADIASGDIYSWTYDTLRRFKLPYHVDIPDLSQPSISDMNLLPDFPYKQLTVTINGTAYYQELGKFIADFENAFPHIRIVNLVIEPVSGSSGDSDQGNEKLSFRMDIVALVMPNPA